ncbi:MAG TPA: biotin/lipoyl-containing protein [Ramlibacter sp.]|uniref:acetyl-CoA carboxylase biotin carboxyl carrier protein n=1 Tax=Ramlibacter sp. TaxID=1917967 RepID=UPI002ED55B0C
MTDSHIARVRQLSQWLEGTDITLLELSGPGELVRLRRDPAGELTELPAAAATSAPAPDATVVRAGSVGVLLLAHPLRTEPLVRVGQQVAAGQAVALLKIGLVLLPVAAPRAGIVRRIVAVHEAAVGFGSPIVELS